MYLWNSAGFCSGTHQIHDLILPLNKWNPERAPCCSGKGHARPPSHLGPSPARWCRLHIQSELDQRAETSADNFDLARCLNPRAHHKRLYGATIATTILVIQESALKSRCGSSRDRENVGSIPATHTRAGIGGSSATAGLWLQHYDWTTSRHICGSPRSDLEASKARFPSEILDFSGLNRHLRGSQIRREVLHSKLQIREDFNIGHPYP
ncbi:hypothetical protein PGT21_017211 [Puccinia graminis f. sp. tritici]|uniref:Uncharacterized protein n=1 Tax=Puccinia graminis f. sp. tritici TaxID=56615 RepID=A0A5B0P3D6_PUCGR|nr:hypothetical protein PGTUg99_024679 [Puccinia graminis f. sp. tritici]KAA1099691.1 hypothetical protein PGT21_017211 [Puccinia graminis f. sp. tritici]